MYHYKMDIEDLKKMISESKSDELKEIATALLDVILKSKEESKENISESIKEDA